MYITVCIVLMHYTTYYHIIITLLKTELKDGINLGNRINFNKVQTSSV